MKFLQLTHYDLDGAGCAAVVKYAIKEDRALGKVQREYCNYDRMPDSLHNMIYAKKFSGDDYCLILTDMRIEDKDLRRALDQPHIKKVLYIDHHERQGGREGLETLKYLNKDKFEYRWRQGYSATKLAFTFFEEQGVVFPDNMRHLMYLTDLYDEWQSDADDFKEAYALNDVFWRMGFDRFMDKYWTGFFWDDESRGMLQEITDERDKHFEEAKKSMHTFELAKERKLLVSFYPAGSMANDYTLRYDADLYLLFGFQNKSGTKLSIRSRNPYFNADLLCRETAAALGGEGGGHKGASGMWLPPEIELETIFDTFMETLQKNYKV